MCSELHLHLYRLSAHPSASIFFFTSFKFRLFELPTWDFSEGTNYCFCCCSDYKVAQVLRSCFQHFFPWPLWHLVHSFAGCEVFWISCSHRVWGSCSCMACGKEHWEIIKDQYCETEWRIPHLKWGHGAEEGAFMDYHSVQAFARPTGRCLYFTTPASARKIFSLPSNNPVNETLSDLS